MFKKEVCVIVFLLSITNYVLGQGKGSLSDQEYMNVIEYCSEQLRSDSLNSFLFKARADAYSFLGKHQESLKDYHSALKLNPDDEELYHGIGVVYYNLNNYKKSIKYYNKAIEIKPDYFRAYFARGLVYYDLKKYHESLLDYKKAITFEPQFADVYNNRGLVFVELGRFKDALGDYEKAIELSRGSVKSNFFYNRGFAKYKLKYYEEAEKDIKYSLKIDPENPYALNYLGSIYYDLGKLDSACMYWVKAKEKGIKVDKRLKKCKEKL